MDTGLYVGLSAQTTLQKRLDTIALNVANLGTPGFRAEEISFSSLLARRGDQQVAYATTGDSFIARRAGPMIQSGSPLDVAIQGDGWLAVRTPQGVAYTRDGRMKIGEDGVVRTINDHAVLDAGGATITVDPQAGPPTISHDGMVTQNGRQTGAIGLFAIDPRAKLTRADGGALTPDRPATPILDFTANGMRQGYIEGANVNPVLEMARLIAVTRTFDQVAGAQQASEQVYVDAIKTLGSPT